VYESKGIREEFAKAQRILEELWVYFHEHADEFRSRHWPKATREAEGLDRAIGDYLCGMTDRYAMRLYQELRLPKPWTVY
jgi:dGTPase